jgi:cell division septum initiation protein DivIVA
LSNNGNGLRETNRQLRDQIRELQSELGHLRRINDELVRTRKRGRLSEEQIFAAFGVGRGKP